jgi:hypothetical protein
MTMVAPYTSGALAGYKRRRAGLVPPRRSGMGQHWYDGIVNAFQNVVGGLPANAPEAGGGSVTISQPFVAQHDFTLPDGTQVSAGQTVTPEMATWYVNSQGQDQSTPDPVAGTTPPLFPPGLIPQIPTWVWWAAGGAALLFLLGFSGLGKLIPRSNPRHYRRRHNRRRSRSRR